MEGYSGSKGERKENEQAAVSNGMSPENAIIYGLLGWALLTFVMMRLDVW